jgi:RHS repeat-associated protein
LSDGTNTYTYGVGRILKSSIVNQQSEISYFLGDALGSARQLTNSTGAVTYAAAYDPYGAVTQTSGAGQTTYGFTGEQQSGDLVYLRARYVNVKTGRFLLRDKWEGDDNRPISMNRWNYTESNPIKYTDPSGFCGTTGEPPCPTETPTPQPATLTPTPTGTPTYNELWPIASYARFDKALDYIYDEMIRNSKGDDFQIMKGMISGDCASYFPASPYVPLANVSNTWSAYLIFFNLTKTGGKWDHKWQLRPMLNIQAGNRADEYFPIRGDNEFEYFYDIWSNIHFGYVGSAIGFPSQDLIDIPDLYNRAPAFVKPVIKPFLGSNGPGDLISVKIGIDLWKNHKNSLTKEQLTAAILNKTNDYLIAQDANSNGVLDKQNGVNPEIGPLLPRGWKNYGQIVGDWK